MGVLKSLALNPVGDSTSKAREKRGVMNFGGTALKSKTRLFGVATSSDINKIAEAVQKETGRNKQLFQVLDLQTTLVHDALWASKTKAKSISELGHRVVELEKALATSLNRLEKISSYSAAILHTKETL